LAQTTGFFRAYQTELKDVARSELAKQIHIGIHHMGQSGITTNGLPIDSKHNRRTATR
jgi:hypothetical protein